MKADFFCCLGVTDKCMLKCRMCYKWQNSIVEVHPTIEQYKKFISDLGEFTDKNVKINFAGGEALLFKGVLDLVRFSSGKGLATNIASNGWLINDDMAKRLADSGLKEINLSLDSLNETVHDYLRGVRGVYRRVMDAIDYLHKYGKNIEVGICCVICDWNLDGLMPLLDWVNCNDKIRGVSFLAPMQPNSTYPDNEWWKGKFSYFWPKDIGKICLFIDKLIEFKKLNNKIGNSIESLENFKLYFRSPGKFVKKADCNLIRALHVNAFGHVFLCGRMETVGDIKESTSLREILDSDKVKEVRKKISECRDNCHFLLNCFS